MQATRNALREHRSAEVSSEWDTIRQWVKRNLTNEKISETGLALATAVSIAYVAARIFQGVQNLLVYSY